MLRILIFAGLLSATAATSEERGYDTCYDIFTGKDAIGVLSPGSKGVFRSYLSGTLNVKNLGIRTQSFVPVHCPSRKFVDVGFEYRGLFSDLYSKPEINKLRSITFNIFRARSTVLFEDVPDLYRLAGYKAEMNTYDSPVCACEDL